MGTKEYLLIAAVILVYIIIFQISKANEYVSTIKGEERTRKSNNKVNAYMLIGFLIVGLFGAWWCNHTLYGKTLFPQGGLSDHGQNVERMMWITLAATGFVFFVTQILLFWFAFKYREAPGRKAFYFPHNNTLELVWTSVPAVVLLILIVFGLKYWFQMTSEAPAQSLVVEVTGHQFGWDFRYPGNDKKLGRIDYKLYNKPSGNSLAVDFNDPDSHDDIRTTEMHIPVGKPVKFVIHAQDVIHDVGLPHFRLKMDAVPGIPTTLWFTPLYTTAEMKQRTGNKDFTYEIACDQMCGKGHFSMRGVIVVESQQEYDAWLKSQKPEYFTIYPDKAPKTDSIATSTVGVANTSSSVTLDASAKPVAQQTMEQAGNGTSRVTADTNKNK